MQKRKFEELNLLDDFMIGTVLNYPKLGPEICRRIVSIVLGKEIKQLKIIPQKTYFGEDTDKHGIRLDVYAEEKDTEDESAIYDLEMDKNRGYELKKMLPKRVRFYHSKIDAESLASGNDYSCLKRVIIIFISSYDPFELERMVYTIKNCCIEEPEMLYEDDAKTIFLYTRGTKGNPPEELKNLLHYLEETKKENANSAKLKDIHRMVETVRHNKEVSWQYMKWVEMERFAIEKGWSEGMAKGIEEGMVKGIEEGREQGIKQGQIINNIHIIRKSISKDIPSDIMSDFLELELDEIEKIIELIQENSDADDESIAALYTG